MAAATITIVRRSARRLRMILGEKSISTTKSPFELRETVRASSFLVLGAGMVASCRSRPRRLTSEEKYPETQKTLVPGERRAQLIGGERISILLQY